jgi:hypothetical protein
MVGDRLVFDDVGRGFFPPEGFMNADSAEGTAGDREGVTVVPSTENTESKSTGDIVGTSSINIVGGGLGGLLFSPHSGVQIGFSSQ